LNEEEFHFILNTVLLIRAFSIYPHSAKETDEKLGFTSKYRIFLFNKKVKIMFECDCIENSLLNSKIFKSMEQFISEWKLMLYVDLYDSNQVVERISHRLI
jgi:hypothetical protein